MATAQGPSGIQQQYCSNQNTGSGFSPVYSIYQSMGSCSKTCRSQYAFAIVKGKDCWCSDYTPSQQADTGDCDSTCPGYPDDYCGNPGRGMFGYIPLDKQPSGTAGASSSQPESTSATSDPPSSDPPSSSPPTSSSPPPSPTSSPEPQTSYVSIQTTVTSVKTKKPEVVTSYVTPTPPSISSSPPPPASSSSSDSSSSESSSSESPSSESPSSESPSSESPSSESSSSDPPSSSDPSSSTSSTRTMTPVVHTSVITRSGSVVTQTVTTTPVVVGGGGDDSPAQSQQLQKKAGLSSGAIAGIVIGTLVGLGALILAAFCLYRRRKNTDNEANPTSRPKRTTSVLSRTGLLSRGRPQSMAEIHEDPFTGGGNSIRHSAMMGAGATVEPSSPLGGSQNNLSDSARRSSRPMVYDQRLNPSALFANQEANGSRISIQDQQDYSRPLGVANPDYRPSFDSR
ncbi:uncharacterized protein LTR77_001825 [Saxophila tyrrhenica]|uniref:WSC domain-containing protein n=1 Tax=Saxophila tyrrhenica TaxID=1690608 RepID=A0AAV9PR00_9PEZI|nr:hypothetical protein LTR77_001825 [Saxophila tyrrhenica]